MAAYFGGQDMNKDARDEDGMRRSDPSGYGQPTHLNANQQAADDKPTSLMSVSPMSGVRSSGPRTENNRVPYIDHSSLDSSNERLQKSEERNTRRDLTTDHYQSYRYSGGLPHGSDFRSPEANDDSEEEEEAKKDVKHNAAMLAYGTTPRGAGADHSGRYDVFRVWAWEIASLVLATALLIATVVILCKFEGKRVPDWGEWVNLNTIVAVLSTVLRGAVALVIAEILSQAKWEWFASGQPRPLRDLHDFDAGSRGIWGALGIVPTAVKGDPLAFLAALLLAASFAVGPTVQQTIRSTVCEYVDERKATLAYAHFVPRAGGYVRGYPGQTGMPDSDVMVAISSSLNFPEGAENSVAPTCASGNCTFFSGDPVSDLDLPPGEGPGLGPERPGLKATSHSTIGLCHRCLDVSSLAEQQDDDTTHMSFGLPNGLSITYGSYGVELNTTTDNENLDWVGDLMTPEFAAASRWSLTNITLLTVTEDGCQEGDWSRCPGQDQLKGPIRDMTGMIGLRGVSCALYPCVRTYVAAVTDGQLDEREIGTPIAAAPDLGGSIHDPSAWEKNLVGLSASSGFSNIIWPYTAIKSPCVANYTVYTEETMADAPLTTELALYATGEDGELTVRQIAAPEPCIYRHDAEFAKAVGTAFGDLLEGSCSIDPRSGPACMQRSVQGRYHKPLERLYGKRQATMDSIDGYFGSVTAAMTRRYRAAYGGGGLDRPGARGPIYDGHEKESMELGLVEGVTWQTSVCTVVHWKWLAFSVSLVLSTSLLLALTIIRGWRNRHVRPVWKASLLPLLFHGDRFGLGQGPVLLTPMAQRAGTESKEGLVAAETGFSNHENQRLMESREMEERAAHLMATFKWPDARARQP